MVIAVDFDGTIVTHDYPEIGKDIGAIPVLKKLCNKGHLLVLNTMRSGETLQKAVEFLEENGIPLYGINENPSQKEWTDSPKVYAHLYIDDASLGIPLTHDFRLSKRPFVDWKEVENFLLKEAFLF